MGNQNSLRQIPVENAAKGLSLSAGPSPKKLSSGTKDEVAKPFVNGNKLELPDRPRRYSDSANGARSRSPSPTIPKPNRFIVKSVDSPATPSPRVHHKSQPSPGDLTNRPRTPRMAFKKFQADFNLSFMNLTGKRSRRQSGDQEVPLSFKIPEGEVDNTPLIPREEIYEPKVHVSDGFDPSSPTNIPSFRARATTISNGHVARLKTLMEGEESSEDSIRNGGRRSEASKRPRPQRKKKIPTVFRYYLGKHEKGEIAGKDYVMPKEVFVAGTMTNWRAVEMIKPKGDLDFVLIIDCTEGDHFFKFYVDGVWRIDDHQEKSVGRSNVEANIIRVKKSDAEVLEALACDSFTVKSSKNEGAMAQKNWGQVKPKWDTAMKNRGSAGSREKGISNPPFLPPQLLTNILNKEPADYADPNLLPEPPTHVILNHLYAQSVKDNVLVLATTTRFRKKYATVVLYKPVD